MELARSGAFFAYLEEREKVRLRKEADFLAQENFEDPVGPPWTDDEILQTYKFTNVRRHHDRTSRELRERLYGPNFWADCRTILMNCCLARYFGTWEFADAVGWQEYDTFDFKGISQLATERLANRQRVFTGAYVISNFGLEDPKEDIVVDYVLRPLHDAAPKLVEIAAETQSWEAVCKEMKKGFGFGGTGFMAKETLLDTTYCGFWKDYHITENDGSFSYPADWGTWTPVGPGALRGAARVMGDASGKGVSFTRASAVIQDLVYWQEAFWDQHEYGTLVPTDIQFGLCEFDKYERVRLGQGRPRSKYNGSARI